MNVINVGEYGNYCFYNTKVRAFVIGCVFCRKKISTKNGVFLDVNWLLVRVWSGAENVDMFLLMPAQLAVRTDLSRRIWRFVYLYRHESPVRTGLNSRDRGKFNNIGALLYYQ